MTAPEVTRTACSYCGVGCGITVETRPDPETGAPTVAKVRGDTEHPTNAGRLCTKGATHAELMAAVDGRLTTALVRAERGAPPVAVSVDDAVTEAANRFRAVLDEHGPDAVSIYVSGQMSIEAQYLATKLAKGYLRTVHLESNSRLCMASAGTGYKQSFGADGPPGSYTDFDCTDLFVVIGSNMADCHPILYLRMVDRLKAGAKLIVVDPRRTATADRADLHLPIRAGTDLALLNGLLALLVEAGDIDDDFIAEHTDGWEAMPEFLADYPPARVAAVTGLDEADIRAAARMIAEAGEWVTCWTMGLNQSTHGTWNTNAICNLHMATGALCRPGSGPMSLTGQPNAMGGREMGYMGPGLPGQRAVLSAADRRDAEERWQLAPDTIRSDVGPGTVAMFERMAEGEIKACWIICTNPVASIANRATVVRALEKAEVVITQDAYADTATNRYADVMLPAALWAEFDAVNVNSDRTMTLLASSVPPAGDARPDWRLICDMATALGFGDAFDFGSAAEVFDEIRTFSNLATGYDLRGITHDRLRETPVQWPSPPGDTEAAHPVRYVNDGVSQHRFVADDGHVPRLAFATPSRRAVFHARPHMDPAEMPDDDFPLVLTTGRLQHQWHTMTKTGRVAKLNKLNPSPFVEVHPTDAESLGLVDGQEVELTTRRGRAVLPARVVDTIRAGTVFAPFHWNDEHGPDLTVNALTNDAVDPDSLQPEFKVCAVALTPVPADLHPAAGELGLTAARPPALEEAERVYLTAFFTGLAGGAPGVPVLPAQAPVRDAVRWWVDGRLAGASSRTSEPAGGTGAPDGSADGDEVTPEAGGGPLVLWASQTGTAEDFAAQVADSLGAARLRNMDDVALDELSGAGEVLVITSTFGDGGPPDNGAAFWDRLGADDAPGLDGLTYAVLGIGDRSYDDFCGHAKSLDARLADLGATRLLERTDCEADDDQPMAEWTQKVGELVGDGGGGRGVDGDGGASGGGAVASEDAAPPTPKAPARFTRKSPLEAPLSRNDLLTSPGATKEVRHVGFDLSEYDGDDDVRYTVGDSLGVFAPNSDYAVDAWLTATGLDGDATIEVDGQERALAQALRDDYDICKVSSGLLTFVAERSPDRAARVLKGPQRELDRWLRNRNGIDVVHAFEVDADVTEWQKMLVRLTPRQYSISSSPLVCPREVQLTMSVVRFRGVDGGARGGVASTFLADRAGKARVPVFVQRAPHFRPPDDGDTPMIMVGPGTGVAPFRAFLHERRALGHDGRNWLFFGDQHRAENFYYRDDLTAMVDDGFLDHLSLAFSRDQAERVYVQHKMLDAGAELWRWLEDGAHLYVCGDASRMAKDVDAALITVIARHGKLSREAAADYKRQLVGAKRYVRDVY